MQGIVREIWNLFLILSLHYFIFWSRLSYGATFLQSSDEKLFTQISAFDMIFHQALIINLNRDLTNRWARLYTFCLRVPVQHVTLFLRYIWNQKNGRNRAGFFRSFVKENPNKNMDLDRHVPGPSAEKRPGGKIP